MPERDPVLRLAALLARGRPIDWDAEERAASTEEQRAGIRQLRVVAAMSLVNRALMSRATNEDLSTSISQAKSLFGHHEQGLQNQSGLKRVDVSATAVPPGSRWGQLEVLERVGGGAFGEVYRARDTRLDREVALKILGREISDPRDEVVREARLLARVRHPNVVTVHGADRIAGQVGIWTEFLRGQTLDRILEEHGVLDGREAALIGIDLCRALSAVHAAGIVHQDVKLSNVMRAEGGRIVLMDFGLGREDEPGFERGGARRTLSGTPLFMAPEVVGGAPSDARSDLYSLGVVLFALITGSLPVEASTLEELRAKHARGERREARDLRPDLGAPYVAFLQRALDPDPERRYQTAGDAEQALLDCLEAPARERQGRRRPRGEATAPHRLPAEIDAFVGREAELAEIERKLASGARLVTLQGPGGIGKTRLAVRYGWRRLEKWPGGVWFCDLTEARTRDGIASAVAEGLGVPLGAGDAVQQLGHAIAGRGPCLLILDNFEQVVDRAAETVAPWLARAAEARFVATSRERLKLPGEDVLVIDALPLPRGMELFVERARRQRPIEIDGPEAEGVREVVRLLEGIPLAIELSAARLRVMTPAQMVDRMAERFRILSAAGTGRHATLRTAIDGSWELLQPWEKAAFAQCAVFEGGFSLDAAEGVLDLRAWPDAPWVIDVLQSLVDKSLIRSWVPEGEWNAARPEVRFGMFVSLQEYAREKLAAEGEIPGVGGGIEATRSAEQRHALWFARFGHDPPMDALDRQGGVERRRVLVRELDNLVAACRRMVTQGHGEVAVRSYRAAWAVFQLKGPFAPAVDLGKKILETPLALDDRARSLTVLGQARQRSGRLEEARADLEAAIAIDRERGDRKSEGGNLALLATVALNEGRMEDALAQLDGALVVHREVGDRRNEGVTLSNLGLAHHVQGRLEEASTELEAALVIARELGNRRSEGTVLGNLGNLRLEQGRIDEARSHFQAALAIHREVGNRFFEGVVLGNLGSLCCEQGSSQGGSGHFAGGLPLHREVDAGRAKGGAPDDLARAKFTRSQMVEARSHLEGALAIHREVGNRHAEGVVLGQLGTLNLAEGRMEEAREFLTKGEALLRAAGAYPIELATLLCTRAELEDRTGNAGAVQKTVAEVETLAANAGVSPDSELGRRLASLRQALPDDPSR